MSERDQDIEREDPLTEQEPSEVKNVSRRGFIAGVVGTAAATLLPGVAKAGGSSRAKKQGTPGQIVYKIHPAIGVARLGNADPSQFFIGPEAPGYDPFGDAPGTAPYPRKVNGFIKPQGARFRVWRYQYDANGVLQPIGEVNLNSPNITNISWSVHLANKKSSFYRFGGPAGESLPALSLRNATVANRSTLETDLGPRFIHGQSAAPVDFRPTGAPGETYPVKPDGITPVISYLGRLVTDALGRLIVIGGAGVAGYNTDTAPALGSYANNDNWFDDISDGPVTARITTADGVTVDADPAWVLVAPPDFAPQIKNTVTMYDLLYDTAVRRMGSLPANDARYMPGGALYRMVQLRSAYSVGTGPEFPNIVPDFDSEIKPILQVGYNYFYVEALVPTKHGSLNDPTLGDPNPAYNANRQFILGYMRPPTGVTGAKGRNTMPHILGDDPYNSHAPGATQNLALTHVQFGLMWNWAFGNFVASGTNPPPPPDITPWGLDKAALENCVGGAFFPGIEASWQIRNPLLFIEPFRLNPNATSQYLNPQGNPEGTPIGPGHFSRQMAVPWMADFNDCRSESSNAWWPGQRPDSVYVEATQSRIDWARPDKKFAVGGNLSTHQDMINNWWKFGFVVYDGTAYVETERNAGIG